MWQGFRITDGADGRVALDEPRVARGLIAHILALDPDHAPARAALQELERVPAEAGP